jgi:hypothetical protein
VCEEGEVLYVPSGWWHLVVNLEESVALTQNFVSPAELGTVLDFMKNKSDQLSGFKKSRRDDRGVNAPDRSDSAVSLAPGRQAASVPGFSSVGAAPNCTSTASGTDECEDGADFAVFELFCERLGRFDPNTLSAGFAQMALLEESRQSADGLPTAVRSIANRKAASTESWWHKLKGNSPSHAATTPGDSPAPAAVEPRFSLLSAVEGADLDLGDILW